MFRAEELGGPEWFGYSVEVQRLADVIDGVGLLLKATAQRKAHLSDRERFPRPGAKERTRRISGRDSKAIAAFMASIN